MQEKTLIEPFVIPYENCTLTVTQQLLDSHGDTLTVYDIRKFMQMYSLLHKYLTVKE